MSAKARVIRGRVLTFRDDPAEGGLSARLYLENGAVLIANGRIESVGEAREVLLQAPEDAAVDDHSDCLIMPGFIDAHIHYPQTQVIGSYGAQLLDWMHNYTFIEEQKFADPDHDDGDGLLHGSPTIGRRVLLRGQTARRAHDRRENDDGPRRPRGAHGHGSARLRRKQAAQGGSRGLAGRASCFQRHVRCSAGASG